MYCTKCGKEIPDGKNYCNNCGAPVKNGPASGDKKKSRIGVTVYCKNCGKEIPDGKNYCIYCGQPIRKTDGQGNTPVMQNTTHDKSNETASGGARRITIIAAGLIAVAVLVFVGVSMINNRDAVHPVNDAQNDETQGSDDGYEPENDGFEPEDDGSMSEEEAQEEGWLYVKSGDRYYPVQETNNVYQSSFASDGARYSVYYMDSSEVSIPSLSEGDQLVFFTDEDVFDFEALEVQKQGHTVDALFFEGSVRFGINGGYVDSDSSYEILTINDEPYEEFYSTNTVNAGDYCTSETGLDHEPACDVTLADLESDEQLTYTYYEGTEKQTDDIYADLDYWIVDGCQRWTGPTVELVTTGTVLKVVLGEESYGTIDTSKLKPGTYIIRADAVSDGYLLNIE